MLVVMMKFEVISDPDRWDRCNERRGPRGTVTCERGIFHDKDFHAGRGKAGQWFLWEDKQWSSR